MSCRFLHVTTDYADYLVNFYQRHAGLVFSSFASQREALMADAFGWADFWSTAMAKLGYEADEVIANVEPLQAQWAWENGLVCGDQWLRDIALEQIRRFQPDVLFFSDFVAFDADFIQRVRAEVSNVRLILGWCGAPYADRAVFGAYDVVLSNIPELVEDFRRQGHVAFLVRHAFEPRLLGRLNAPTAARDFVFVGSVGLNDPAHLARAKLLAGLLNNTDLHILGRSTARPFLRHLAAMLPRWGDRLSAPDKRRLWSACQPPQYGLSMFEALRDSRVSLNTHIDISRSSASNMRLFEATGVASCLLTDWKSDLHDMFEPDAEVLTYRTLDECVEKVQYLLNHEDVRRSVAEAGQRRTLRDHTFDRRAEQLHDVIRGAMKGAHRRAARSFALC